MSQNFEGSLAELEKIVAEMEIGDLPLQHALALFERGIHLSRYCQQQLSDAERKVELLIKGQDGTILNKSFDSEDD